MRKLVIVQRFLIDLIPVLTDFPQQRPQFAGQLAMEFGCSGKPLRDKFRRRSWRKLALRILFRRNISIRKRVNVRYSVANDDVGSQWLPEPLMI